MGGFDAHHLQVDRDHVAGNGGRGRVFFVPGSLARARQIAERFDDLREHDNPRRLTVFTGSVEADGLRIDVGVVPTGMGCPSLGIVVTELLEAGVRRLVRVGSAGSLQTGRVGIGDLVIARAAVRDEGSSDAFAPRELPAVAHHDWILSLARAAELHGVDMHTYCGLVHTKDTLYGREFPSGPLAGSNQAYMEMLTQHGVLASEMESSHLFLLASLRGSDLSPVSVHTPSAEVVKAGSILAIIGDEDGWASAEEAHRTEDLAVAVALRAGVELIRAEGPGVGA